MSKQHYTQFDIKVLIYKQLLVWKLLLRINFKYYNYSQTKANMAKMCFYI